MSLTTEEIEHYQNLANYTFIGKDDLGLASWNVLVKLEIALDSSEYPVTVNTTPYAKGDKIALVSYGITATYKDVQHALILLSNVYEGRQARRVIRQIGATMQTDTLLTDYLSANNVELAAITL